MTIPAVNTRPVSAADEPLLFELYVASEAAAWTASIPHVDHRPVLRRMFALRQSELAGRFPTARHEIIEVDGQAAGQIHWADLDAEVYIVDVGVLPQYRRRGTAAAIYTRLVEYARRAGKPVRSIVNKSNRPSLALHARLGFTAESETATHYGLVAR